MTAFPVFNNAQLLSLLKLSKDATAIYSDGELTIAFANDAMLRIWGKDETVQGKRFEEALPEMEGQMFTGLLKEVWRSGKPYEARDTRADIVVDGLLQTFYFDFLYQPIFNEKGETYAIIHTATEVSDRMLAWQIVQEKREAEQQLNEELAAVNEELQAGNEELASTNEELTATNEELSAATDELLLSRENLEKLNRELAAGESRFRALIQQAPIGMCLISARDLRILEVNEAYLELVGKTREQFADRTIWEAVPEAAETYAPVMNNVIATGEAFIAGEHELLLIRREVPESVFINFVYEPIRDTEGIVTGILVTGYEVTELVNSRLSIEQAEERTRLAVEAAGIGLFDKDMRRGTLVVSGDFEKIYGLNETPDEHVGHHYTHPDDRPKRLAAHEAAIKTGGLFYEVRIIRGDGTERWVRAQGQMKFDEDGKPARLLGTVLDITEFKILQQQKDDFISIASHELKTPITALKASLQLMDRMKEQPDRTMLSKLILQGRRSVERVSALVDDLLNVSKLQQPDVQLSKNRFILSQLVASVVNPITLSSRKSIKIEGALELEVYADEHRIDQVLTNLISNAVKYAPQSEQVTVTILQQTDTIEVRVRDQGAGIPADKLPLIFERYFRVDPSGKQASGLGLGLYISAEIIAKHGGKIGVESEEGRGSTFWFTLPAQLD